MNPKVKKLLPIFAIVAIGLSIVVVFRSTRVDSGSKELTKDEEKLMRTPTGVIKMPPEAMEAMRRANQGTKSPTGR